MTRIVALSGGVGGGRFVAGLARVADPDKLDVVVNTGDDERMRGLHVSADVDSVLYHLAGLSGWERGWGVDGDTFSGQARYAELASRLGDLRVDLQDWFALGDLDLATHMLRTRLLEAGLPLSAATDALRVAMGVSCRVHPMAETPVPTILTTAAGERLALEEWFVRRRQADEIVAVEFRDADVAQVPGAVLDALERADAILFTPSNPIVSIGPILAVPAIRAAVERPGRPRVGVSPVIGGRTVKGPADRLLRALGYEATAFGAASVYEGLLDVWVIDHVDAPLSGRLESELGMRTVVCDTMMRSAEDAGRLAKIVLEAAWS